MFRPARDLSGERSIIAGVAILALIILIVAAVVPRQASAHPWRNNNCGFITTPGIERGEPMELQVWGHLGPLLACGKARRIARAVPRIVPKGPWGHVEGWKCRWSTHTVLCRRHGNWMEQVASGGD